MSILEVSGRGGGGGGGAGGPGGPGVLGGGLVNGTSRKSGRLLCDGHLRLIENLRVNLIQLKNLATTRTTTNSNNSNKINNNNCDCRWISIAVRLDTTDIHQCSTSARDNMCSINDDFVHEISTNFSCLNILITENGRIPRLIGQVSIRKRDIVKYSGEDRYYRLSAMSRQNEICGQICLLVHQQQRSSRISVRVVDYKGLNIRGPVELYLLVTLQNNAGRSESKRLQIGSDKESIETVWFDCDRKDLRNKQLRLSVWHDVDGGRNSCFLGQVRISVDNLNKSIRDDDSIEPSWYYLKSRHPHDEVMDEENPETSMTRSQLGELRMRLFYTADHVLPLNVYKTLRSHLIGSLKFHPFFASFIGILEHLPSLNLTTIARPLMKLFVQFGLIRELLNILCVNDITRCQDVNTLFRSQSLATKIIHEQMKFFGHHYLVVSLKPVIDMIYNERKCCEVDPVKLKHGDSLESNKLNLIVYGEIAFSRLVDSFRRCPLILKQLFSNLREIAAVHFPERQDIQRLVLSSFIIMRFFAAAIMNPKLFGLKRDPPDGIVCRTLVLLSKILQRLSNCVVSTGSLTEKEPWLSPVLERFTDETHKLAMIKFLNRLSLAESDAAVSTESLSVLRDGFFIERNGREKHRILRNLMNNKRRYVVLTETEICWQKTKNDLEPKGRMPLQEVCQIEPVVDAKNVFRIASPDCELQLQAPNIGEMNEWIVQIQKQRKRYYMLALRNNNDANDLFEIDTERELETLHMIMYEHIETLKFWNSTLNTDGTDPANQQQQQQQVQLPRALQEQLNDNTNREEVMELLGTTIQNILQCIFMIESAHQEIVNRFIKQVPCGKGVQELPIGDDNYLLLKSRLCKNWSIEGIKK